MTEDRVTALRQFIETEKRQIDPTAYNQATTDMNLACENAARSNDCDALNLLLDHGCLYTTDVILAALENECTEVIDTLIARGWNINTKIRHAGDALM